MKHSCDMPLSPNAIQRGSAGHMIIGVGGSIMGEMTLVAGVIGAGIVAENNHLPALARNPRTALGAVCDTDEERAREAASEYGCQAYTNAERMFDAEDLGWVHVATPVQTHAALATKAIEAGVPVTIQKPAAVTTTELATLHDRAAETDVPVSVVYNWLYYPVVRELRRRIDSEEIGDIRAVETTLAGEGRPDETYRGEWVLDLPGGDLEEGMPHPLSLTLGIGGCPRSEDEVSVLTRSLTEYDHGISYDGTQIQYVTAGNTLCSIRFLSGSARDNRISVYGSTKAFHVDIPTMTIDEHDVESGPYHFPNERFRRNSERIKETIHGLQRNVKRYVRGRIEDSLDRHTEKSIDGHYYLFNEAAKALEQGRQPPVSLELSRWTLTIMEKVRKSAEA